MLLTHFAFILIYSKYLFLGRKMSDKIPQVMCRRSTFTKIWFVLTKVGQAIMKLWLPILKHVKKKCELSAYTYCRIFYAHFGWQNCFSTKNVYKPTNHVVNPCWRWSRLWLVSIISECGMKSLGIYISANRQTNK